MNRTPRGETLDSQPASSPHPDAETLVAYRAGELSPPESERLDAHLGECSGCRRILQDLAGEIDDPALDVAWQAMQGRLRDEREEPRQPSRPRLAWAAVLFLFVAGGLIAHWTGMWLPRQPDSGPGIGQPAPSPTTPLPRQGQGRPPEEPLYPRSFSRASEIPTLPLLEQEDSFLIMLFLPPRLTAEQYRLRISDSADHQIWTGSARRESTNESLLSIRVPRARLDPGTYTLQLFPAEADSETPVAEYIFLLEEQAAH